MSEALPRDVTDVQALQTQLAFERQARQALEHALEEKKLQLHYMTHSLQRLAEQLENRVEQRSAELVVARDQALQASRAKSQFLSSMSHELRSPLNVILGFTDLLATDADVQPTQLESVREITKAGRHLLKLIDEILDLANIEAGHLQLHLEPIDPYDLLDPLLQSWQTQAAERDIRMQLKPCLVPLVKADALRLRQVLAHLLSNALKYNRHGGLIEVWCEAADEPGLLRMCVRDTGPGIAIEDQPNLFIAFERVGQRGDGDWVEGSGIGLVISKRLMEAMGGKIGVTSQLGEGSTFWIDCPAEAVPTVAV